MNLAVAQQRRKGFFFLYTAFTHREIVALIAYSPSVLQPEVGKKKKTGERASGEQGLGTYSQKLYVDWLVAGPDSALCSHPASQPTSIA